MKIIQSKNYYGYNIEKIEGYYNAKYIGDFSIRTKNESWSEKPVSVFYVERPDREKGHSNYLGVYSDFIYDDTGKVIDAKTYVTDGESAFSQVITGLKTSTGDILISGFGHQFTLLGEYFIDGGRDYIKTSEKGVLIPLMIDGPELVPINIKEIEKKLELAESEYD